MGSIRGVYKSSFKSSSFLKDPFRVFSGFRHAWSKDGFGALAV